MSSAWRAWGGRAAGVPSTTSPTHVRLATEGGARGEGDEDEEDDGEGEDEEKAAAPEEGGSGRAPRLPLHTSITGVLPAPSPAPVTRHERVRGLTASGESAITSSYIQCKS